MKREDFNKLHELIRTELDEGPITMTACVVELTSCGRKIPAIFVDSGVWTAHYACEEYTFEVIPLSEQKSVEYFPDIFQLNFKPIEEMLRKIIEKG
jgi:hypothetical protein